MRLDSQDRIHLRPEEARGGEVILRTRRRRMVFLAGLVGAVILGFILTFAQAAH